MNFSGWIRLSVINLLWVGLLGVIMRYKIGFEFPFLEQKFLQHGHSHFAFAGWITQTLFIILLRELEKFTGTTALAKYKPVIWLNAITAYGMLLSFVISGYSFVSIAFSTISILVFFLFSFMFIRDTRHGSSSSPGFPWMRAGLWFGMLSSLGTFFLAWMMATKNIHQNEYLGSLYFYLHFQYNGWFFFACMGTIVNRMHHLGFIDKRWQTLFRMMCYTCIPAFFLSILWARLPIWLYILVVIAAVIQFVAWIWCLSLIRKAGSGWNATGKYLFWFAAAALTIKFTLQLGSVVPEISKMAFGFRTIIIAYLHLVLLAGITVMLNGYMYHSGLFRNAHAAGKAIILFTIGIFLTELVLLIQGVASFSYTVIPKANEILFILAVLMFLAIFMLVVSQFKMDKKQEKPLAIKSKKSH